MFSLSPEDISAIYRSKLSKYLIFGFVDYDLRVLKSMN